MRIVFDDGNLTLTVFAYLKSKRDTRIKYDDGHRVVVSKPEEKIMYSVTVPTGMTDTIADITLTDSPFPLKVCYTGLPSNYPTTDKRVVTALLAHAIPLLLYANDEFGIEYDSDTEILDVRASSTQLSSDIVDDLYDAATIGFVDDVLEITFTEDMYNLILDNWEKPIEDEDEEGDD